MYTLVVPSPLQSSFSIEPPAYFHEVHLYIDHTLPNLFELERKVRMVCQQILAERGQSDVYWSCQLVDVYRCRDTMDLSVAFQCGYSSVTRVLSRRDADQVRSVMETELPIRLNLR